MTKISCIKKAERVSPPAPSGTQARSKASSKAFLDCHAVFAKTARNDEKSPKYATAGLKAPRHSVAKKAR